MGGTGGRNVERRRRVGVRGVTAGIAGGAARGDGPRSPALGTRRTVRLRHDRGSPRTAGPIATRVLRCGSLRDRPRLATLRRVCRVRSEALASPSPAPAARHLAVQQADRLAGAPSGGPLAIGWPERGTEVGSAPPTCEAGAGAGCLRAQPERSALAAHEPIVPGAPGPPGFPGRASGAQRRRGRGDTPAPHPRRPPRQLSPLYDSRSAVLTPTPPSGVNMS